MAGITLAIAEARLAALLDMEARGVREADIDGQHLVYHTLKELQEAIQYWDARVKELDADADGGITPRQITPETDV